MSAKPRLVPGVVLSSVALLTASCAQYTSSASSAVISVVTQPHTATVAPGKKVSFSATVSGASSGQSAAVIWSVQEPGGGSVDLGGIYTAPPTPGTFHVLATSFADPYSSDVATVTVQSAAVLAVAVTPKSASTLASGTVQLSAVVSGAAAGQSTAVTWSVQESGGGSVNASGLYTPPATTGTYHVIAKSVADPTQSDTATVQVTATPVITVSVSPKTAATTTGRALTFSATVTGTTAGQSTAVTWSVQESSGGAVDGSGHYTAPASAGTYHVIATSAADGTKKDTATVTVTSIAVAISPKTAATTSGGALTFSATVTGTVAGQSTAVTWSVQEAGGGTVDTAGHYVAPGTTGTFHVVATSVTDTSRQDSATVTVSAPVVAVTISPGVATVSPAGTQTFTATVTGTTNLNVTWSVQEGAAGGSIDSSGKYTAPTATGTYHVVATSVADSTKSGTATVNVATFSLIPADRLTTWNPGIPGGVPSRTTQCGATVDAAAYGNGSADATAGIQAAVNACPVGQVVRLSAGTFKVTDTINISKGIVLRGAGPDQTKLMMTPAGASANVIEIGTQFFKYVQSVNLVTNAVKGSYSVTLASNPGLKVGEIVGVDEVSDPAITQFNPATSTLPTDDSRGWFTRQNRMVGQTMEIASISGNTVTFTTPFHIDLTTANSAQLSRFSSYAGGPQLDAVKYAGLEDLYVYGGGNGNIQMDNAAYSWVKHVESDFQKGESIGINGSFRCIVRDSYFHSTQDPNPGGGGYGISFSMYTSDTLVENNISWNMNKVMVMRASGGGNVIAYNYMEDGWISYATGFVEVGLNASHMTTPHYELFEGNQAFNFDGDNRWGNGVYITVFRNHLTGKRRSIAPLQIADQGNPRAIGLMYGHWWYSFVGNVLGTAGQNPSPNSSYVYETFWPWNDNPVGMWRLGYNNDDWSAQADPKVSSTLIREGNFDYATNQVKWSGTPQALPESLYLAAKPAFFGANPWPWVDAAGTTKIATLPARVRFDACGSSKKFCP